MKKLLIPHPILLPEGPDYINGCKFDMTTGDAQHTMDGNIRIPITFALKSEFIHDLISKNKAKIIVLVKCSKTYKRMKIEINGMEHQLTLPLSDYLDKITLLPYITATEAIESFKSAEHHDEFTGIHIGVPAGAILARGSDSELTIDSLQTLNAAMQLMTNNKLEDGEYRFDVTDNYIKIYMNDETRRKVEILRKSKKSRLYPSVYMAVLTYAMQNIEDNEDKKWAEALKKTLDENKIKIDDQLKENAYMHTQRLMEYPLKYMMEDSYTHD